MTKKHDDEDIKAVHPAGTARGQSTVGASSIPASAPLAGATSAELQARIEELEEQNRQLAGAKTAGGWDKVEVEALAEAMHRYHPIDAGCKNSACAKAVLEDMRARK